MPVVALVKLGSTDEAVSAVAQMLESDGVEAITVEGFEQQLTALPLLYLLVFIDSQYDMAHSFLEIYHLRESHRLTDNTVVIFLVDDKILRGRTKQSEFDLEFFLKEITRVDLLWYCSLHSLDKDPNLQKLLSFVKRRLRPGGISESNP